MFPELERKIDEHRRWRSHMVIPLLCALTKAEQAQWRGDLAEAQYIVKQALKL